MQAEYSQKKNRLKLRVTTSTGLNLLCTANRSQKVKQLLPHIVKLYQQVKEDQGIAEEDQVKFRPFIKYIRKDEFLIAASQLVGDIFDDNDEVFCEIGKQPYKESAKKQHKVEKSEQPSKHLPTEDHVQTVPKTKKIKKHQGKKQDKHTQQTPVNQDSQKSHLPPKKQPEQTKPSQAQTKPSQTQIKPSQTQTKPSQTQTKPISDTNKPLTDTKNGQESKQKKKKNKNKANHQQTNQNGQTLHNQVPTPKKPTESLSQKPKSGAKKVAEQKPQGTPMLSSQQLSKFKQMLKRTSSAPEQQPSA